MKTESSLVRACDRVGSLSKQVQKKPEAAAPFKRNGYGFFPSRLLRV